MMHTALRAFTLTAALFGAATAQKNKLVADKSTTAAKVRNVQLCLSEFAVAGNDPGVLDPASTGTFAFNGGVFDCSSFDPATGLYSRRIGELGWSCEWAPTPQGPAQLIPCDGLLSIASSPKVAFKTPLSTLFFTFWISEANLELPALLTAGQSLVAPTVVKSTGSWPVKHDSFKGFGWSVDPVTQQLYLDIAYKTNGWNPYSSK